MAQFSSAQYDSLERSIRDGRRISIMRRGTEYLIVPLSIGQRSGREAIEARNPTTGDHLVIFIDDVDSFAVVR
jgi:hypothetical protein